MKTSRRRPVSMQLIWGIALLLAGIGVLVRIPQVMPRLAEIEQFAGAAGYVRFCFYLMAVILIGGGIKKVIRYHRQPSSGSEDKPVERDDNG